MPKFQVFNHFRSKFAIIDKFTQFASVTWIRLCVRGALHGFVYV